MAEKSGARSKESRSAQRDAALTKANQRREAIRELKAEARSGRLGIAALLADRRAKGVRVLTLLPMVPRCTLRVALEALLICQINGARTCEELSAFERIGLAKAVADVGHGVGAAKRRALPDDPVARDVELDRALAKTRTAAVAVELRPAEFAAARTGLEADPLLLRMVDRLIAALRLYAERDDDGRQARVVLGQWIRYRNYLAGLARGTHRRPSMSSPARPE